MNREESVEIVEFPDGEYAIRRTKYYTHTGNTYQYLDASNLVYWWSDMYIRKCKTLNLDKLKKCMQGVTNPDDINRGKPIDLLAQLGECPIDVSTQEPDKPKKRWWKKLPKFSIIK